LSAIRLFLPLEYLDKSKEEDRESSESESILEEILVDDLEDVIDLTNEEESSQIVMELDPTNQEYTNGEEDKMEASTNPLLEISDNNSLEISLSEIESLSQVYESAANELDNEANIAIYDLKVGKDVLGSGTFATVTNLFNIR
jgi:hypothetical protein